MPELPEMENYRRLLTKLIVSRPITDVAVTREKSVNLPPNQFRNRIIHRKIESISRRAKYLLFSLDSGDILLLHLMLGGVLAYGKEQDKPDRTVQVTLSFGQESLYFIGLRLGFLHILTQQEVDDQLAKLGPEPLEPSFTPEALKQILHNRTGILKAGLVNQSWLAGIGNCYSDEICHAAGLLPLRKCSSLNNDEIEKLYAAIIAILQRATQYGGYMDLPLYPGDRLTGSFDPLCAVYDREGEPCLWCEHPIRKEIVHQRKCFYCPQCQY